MKMFQATLLEVVILRVIFQPTQLGDMEDDNTKEKARLDDLEAQIFEGTSSTRSK
jgi:hypothetical protein